MLLQDAVQPPRDVVIAPGMGRLFISPPAPAAPSVAAPLPAAPAEPQAETDAVLPCRSRKEVSEVTGRCHKRSILPVPPCRLATVVMAGHLLPSGLCAFLVLPQSPNMKKLRPSRSWA